MLIYSQIPYLLYPLILLGTPDKIVTAVCNSNSALHVSPAKLYECEERNRQRSKGGKQIVNADFGMSKRHFLEKYSNLNSSTK